MPRGIVKEKNWK